MNWYDWEDQERFEEEERRWAEEEYTELHRDEPSPWCPECEMGIKGCNCMVYGRKLFPSNEQPYDWHTRMKPLHGEDHIEIMLWKDWCGNEGEQWRKENIPPLPKLKKVRDIIVDGRKVGEEWE